MNRLRLLGIGLRVSLGAGRTSWARLLMMASGIAVGVAMLLGLFSVLPAMQAHRDRAEGRGISEARQVDASADVAGVLASWVNGYWRGQPLQTNYLAVAGPFDELPAGIPRLPRPGEAYVSPALAEALARHSDELDERVPGQVVGTIADEGLVGPDELFAWVGVTADELPGEARFLVRRFDAGPPPGYPRSGYVPDDLEIALFLALVGLLIPVYVLIATLARLSGRTRDARIAALRLVGATRREARWLAAAETGAAAAVGSALGVVVFLLARGPVAALFPVESGVFAGDVRPPLWLGLAVCGSVPVVAVLVAAWSMRSVVSSPLGVVRRAEPRIVPWWRLAPLTISWILLGGAWLRREALLNGDKLASTLMVVGAGLVLLGLALAAAALSRLAGLLMLRLGRGVSTQLAGRRLLADPGASARVVTGAVMVVATVSWLLAFLPLLSSAWGGWADEERVRAVKPGTLVSGEFADPTPSMGALAAQLERLPGVSSVPMTRITLAEHSDGWPITAVVVDCPSLLGLARDSAPSCEAGQAYRLVDLPEAPASSLAGRRFEATAGAARGTVKLPPTMPRLRLGDHFSNAVGLSDTVLLPPEAVPAALRAPQRLLVGTDGQPETVETIRDLSWREVSTPLMTLPEQAASSNTEGAMIAGYRVAALAGALFVLLVASLSLVVSTVDGVFQQRRQIAGLLALGVPLRVLRRAALWQTVVPLLLNLALAAATGVVTSVMYVRLDELRTPLPWSDWAGLAAVTAVVVVAVSALALPFLRTASRPEALRTE